MTFFAGAIAGGILGLAAGMLLQRRAGGTSVLTNHAAAATIAVIALVVAAGALANSERDRDHNPHNPAAAGSPASTTTAPATTGPGGRGASTSTTSPGGGAPDRLVSVPNVSHPALARKDAVAILERAGLEVSIDSLPLANVPPDFVISQNPLPEAMTTTGSTVTLVVSAPA